MSSRNIRWAGSTSSGRLNLYKRGCFVLKSKQFQEAKIEASQLELVAQAAGVIKKKTSSQTVRGTGDAFLWWPGTRTDDWT